MATRSAEPSLEAMRDLVLDYLLHNAYMDTARVFASESSAVVRANEIHDGLASDAVSDAASTQPSEGIRTSKQMDEPGLTEGELELVRLRREIKVHILSGRVDEATQLLNAHFPAVLQENESDSLSVPPPVPFNSSSPFYRLQYTSQLSVKPIHIALNLRILAFIEAARTDPLIYPGDPIRSPFVPSALAVSNPSSEAYSAHQTALLHRAQRLYAAVESLRDTRDRDVYRKELNQVGGLLAYVVPEASPIAKYLSQERREAVADQVNGAILYHMGKPAASHIELYVRQTSTVMSVMRDNNIAPTPQMRSLLPPEPVIQQPPPPPSQTKPVSGKTEKPDKAESEKVQACLTFNLRQFLDSP